MYFPSKKGITYFLILWIPIFGFIFFIFWVRDLVGTIFLCLAIIFFAWIWFGTGYKIEKGQLKIRSGPMKKTIRINQIHKLRRVKNPFATAAALSIKRIEVTYEGGMIPLIYISPKDEDTFIKLLLKENPNIKIDKNILPEYDRAHIRNKELRPLLLSWARLLNKLFCQAK